MRNKLWPSVIGLSAAFYALAPAQASEIISIQQVGSNVVATASGTLDITDLSDVGTGDADANIAPQNAQLVVGAGSQYTGYGGLLGPTDFGTGSNLEFASSATGDYAGIARTVAILVPTGYVSGSELSGTATWDSATLSALGIDPGTYTWTWGSGPDADSLTLYAGVPAPAPEPSSLTLLMAGLAGALAFKFLRRSEFKSRMIIQA